MKILIDFEPSKDERTDLYETFNKVGMTNDNYIVDTKELTTLDFDDYLEKWIDVGFSVVWDKDRKHYILTDIS